VAAQWVRPRPGRDRLRQPA